MAAIPPSCTWQVSRHSVPCLAPTAAQALARMLASSRRRVRSRPHPAMAAGSIAGSGVSHPMHAGSRVSRWQQYRSMTAGWDGQILPPSSCPRRMQPTLDERSLRGSPPIAMPLTHRADGSTAPALEATNIMRLLDFAWFRAECDHALRTRLDRHSRDCFDLVSKYLLALKARLAVWSC